MRTRIAAILFGVVLLALVMCTGFLGGPYGLWDTIPIWFALGIHSGVGYWLIVAAIVMSLGFGLGHVVARCPRPVALRALGVLCLGLVLYGEFFAARNWTNIGPSVFTAIWAAAVASAFVAVHLVHKPQRVR
jgi:hypothetical protein